MGHLPFLSRSLLLHRPCSPPLPPALDRRLLLQPLPFDPISRRKPLLPLHYGVRFLAAELVDKDLACGSGEERDNDISIDDIGK